MKNDYKISVGSRVLCFFTGFFYPLIGFALGIIFKKDDNKKDYAEFLNRGAVFFVILSAIGLLLNIIILIINLVK